MRGGKRKGLVLDVGCGVGQVVIKLAEEKFQSVGIDVSPIAIKLAVKSAERNPHAFFMVASGYNLPFKQGAFDVVGCFDLLEHLDDPEVCIDEMLKVMKENGYIIIASPNLLCPVYGKELKRKLLNMKRLLLKMIKRDEKNSFEHIRPKLDWSGREVGYDLDAITLVDSITIKRLLKRKKVKVTYQSSYLGSRNKLVEKLSTLPLLRNIGGGIFVIGKIIKTREQTKRVSNNDLL